MKQRVAIARSLAFDPEVLLMDETICSAGRTDARVAAGRASAHLEGHRQDHPVSSPTESTRPSTSGNVLQYLTSRPGRVKTIVDIDIDRSGDDVRSGEEFRVFRHRIWTLLAR